MQEERMNRVRSAVRALALALDHMIGWILIALVVLNGASVFMRYVMNDSISWSEEGIRYLACWITFLGGVSAAWMDEHLDMNLLEGFGGPLFQAAQRASLQFLAFVFGAIVAWQGTIYCIKSGMQTAPTTGLLMIFVYGSIPIGGFCLALVSLVKVYDVFKPPAVVDQGAKHVL
jgi:TRAP-type C4-dicarboxylate transport system permease small subunit